jgi:alkylation response protein AidB-like acyl-CoA dehydrogenase
MSVDTAVQQHRDDVLDATDADLAVAEAAFAETVSFLVTAARPWFEADGLPVREEPTIVHAAGALAVELGAALAARRSDAIGQAEARLLAGDVAKRAVRFLFEAGGTSTTDDPLDFGRHHRAVLETGCREPVRAARLAAGRTALARRSSFREAHPIPVGVPVDRADAHRRADAIAHQVSLEAARRDQERATPKVELETISRSGLLAITVPIAFGGTGLGFADALEVSRRLSIGDSSVGQIMTIHYSMLESLIRTGTEAQLARWLPKVVQGARFGNAAAERGVAHAKVTATRLAAQPDGSYRLKGRKFYSTGATGADFVSILAIGDDGQPSLAVVAAGSEGLTILDDWRGLGQRGTGSGTTILDNVLVAPDEILPRWLNADVPTTGNAAANLAHVGIDLGLARAAIHDAVDLVAASDDPVPDEILGAIGVFSARLAASEALFAEALVSLRALASQTLTEEIVQRFSLEVSIVKVHAGELAIDIATGLIDIAAEFARPGHIGLDRHWRNARTHTLHDPSRWRYLRIGDHALNGRLPPRNRTN